MPPRRLPIFPLNLVLFPGAPLPLHIFEPRYRQMLTDCLEKDGRFGITPIPDPAAGSLGCIAHIRATQSLPDGRSNIVVIGESRFEVESLLEEDTPYRLALVNEFGDQPGTAPSSDEIHGLRRLADEYRVALRLLSDAGADAAGWSDDAGGFSFQVAALLEIPVAPLLHLLSLRSVEARVSTLLELLPGLLRETSIRAATHARARTNGKGGVKHDIVLDGS